MTKFEELKHYSQRLEQDVASKEAEICLLQSQMYDTTSPSIAMTEVTCLVAEMLEDNIAFVKKNGMTDKAKQSRDRLMKLLTIGENFNQLSSHNHGLKLLCRQMYDMGVVLRIENLKLKTELKAIEAAENF